MITSPGYVPPGMATVTSLVTARAGPGDPGTGAGLGPVPARKANRERQGRRG
jgi:hypothetical protein